MRVLMKLLMPLAVLGSVLALAACGGSESSSDSGGTGTLTLSSFGGATTDNLNEIYLKDFAEEKDLEVLNDTVDFGKIYSMVEADNVTWDVVQGDGYFARKACRDGVLEPLSEEVLQAAKDAGLPEDTYGKCHIQPWSYSWVLAYSTKLPQKPDSWSALTDTETYPGKRSLWSVDQVGIFEGAEMAAGVADADIYPIDFDTVFGELDKIKDDILFTESLVDQSEAIVSGKASMGILTSSRAREAADEGEPIDIRWEQQVLTGDTFFVPKGSPNASVAMEFLAEMLNTDKLVEFAQANGYGPNGTVAQEALKELPSCDGITTCPKYLPTAIRLSDEWWDTHREEATDRWKEWLGA